MKTRRGLVREVAKLIKGKGVRIHVAVPLDFTLCWESDKSATVDTDADDLWWDTIYKAAKTSFEVEKFNARIKAASEFSDKLARNSEVEKSAFWDDVLNDAHNLVPLL